jgi:hypothetical protein
MKLISSLLLVATLIATATATATATTAADVADVAADVVAMPFTTAKRTKISKLFKVRSSAHRTLANPSSDDTASAATGEGGEPSNDKSIWDWWFVFQDSSYFLPVIVVAGVLILGCGLYGVIRCCKRRRQAIDDLDLDLFDNKNAKCGCGAGAKCGCGAGAKCGCGAGAKCGCGAGAKCGCGAGAKCGCGAGAKCGCGAGAKCGCGAGAKCGCQGAKSVMKPTIAPVELYATRSLTASTAIDASVPLSDPESAIQAIV